MLKTAAILTYLSVSLLLACNSTGEKTTTTDSTEVSASDTMMVASTTVFDPDLTDTIPGDGYDPSNSDTSKAAIIRKTIMKLFSNDLNVMGPEDRKFKFDAFDLNNDGKEELVVGLFTSYFCGTGGCSGMILNPDGSVINQFSVTEYPIYVAASSSEGFQDLIVDSRGFHHIKMKNGKYPSNPSVQPAFKGEPPGEAPALLDIYNVPYPAFTF